MVDFKRNVVIDWFGDRPPPSSYNLTCSWPLSRSAPLVLAFMPGLKSRAAESELFQIYTRRPPINPEPHSHSADLGTVTSSSSSSRTRCPTLWRSCRTEPRILQVAPRPLHFLGRVTTVWLLSLTAAASPFIIVQILHKRVTEIGADAAPKFPADKYGPCGCDSIGI